jgi:hypothetical protein
VRHCGELWPRGDSGEARPCLISFPRTLIRGHSRVCLPKNETRTSGRSETAYEVLNVVITALRCECDVFMTEYQKYKSSLASISHRSMARLITCKWTSFDTSQSRWKRSQQSRDRPPSHSQPHPFSVLTNCAIPPHLKTSLLSKECTTAS